MSIYRKVGRIMQVLLVAAMFASISACGKQVEVNEINSGEEIVEQIEVSDIGEKEEIEEEVLVEEQTETISSSEPEESLEEVAELVESNELRLVMVGDILLHTKVSDSAKREDGSYDYNPIFSHTSFLIKEADLALVNEEVIIGGEELGISGYPAFNAPYAIGDALVQNGFDVILHATNHAVDKGKNGLVNCMNFWQDNYPEIEVLGIHDSEEDQRDVYYYEQNGIKIAILNYTYGTNGISLPSDMPWSVDLLNQEKVIRDLQEAEANADFTVVCPHWGTEYNLGISGEQKKWAKIFVENGADLVIGTHPHVIEPVEWYTDEETGNSALIYYSIGNYVNWTSGTGAGTADRMVGGLADVTLIKNENGVEIEDYTVHGLVCHLSEGEGGVSTYLLSDYDSTLADENLIKMQDSNFSYEYCLDLCDKVWRAWE